MGLFCCMLFFFFFSLLFLRCKCIRNSFIFVEEITRCAQLRHSLQDTHAHTTDSKEREKKKKHAFLLILRGLLNSEVENSRLKRR